MSLGPPMKPAKLGPLVSGYATQSCNEPVVATDGTVSQSTTATVSNIPCNIQQMSSAEAIRYGKPSVSGLFNLHMPVRLPDGSGDMSVVIEDAFSVDSVEYAVIGTPIIHGNSGQMTVPTERRSL